MNASTSAHPGELTASAGVAGTRTGLFARLGVKPRSSSVAAAVLASIWVLVSGCGSTDPHATPPPTAPPAPATVSADLAAALPARLNAADGPLVSAGPARIQTAAEARADSEGREHAADALDGAGSEDLTTKIGNDGIRVVFQFPDAGAGYIDRAANILPMAGATEPWAVHQNYPKDIRLLRKRPAVDDGLRFSRVAAKAG